MAGNIIEYTFITQLIPRLIANTNPWAQPLTRMEPMAHRNILSN